MRHPIVILLALAAVLTVAVHSLAPASVEHWLDPIMLTVIVLAYLAAALVMLWRTGWAMWTPLGAGLLATMTADALLYGYILLPRLDVDRVLADWWLALVRALLVVGGPFVLFGLRREWKATDTRQDAREVSQNQREEFQAGRDTRWDARDV